MRIITMAALAALGAFAIDMLIKPRGGAEHRDAGDQAGGPARTARKTDAAGHSAGTGAPPGGGAWPAARTASSDAADSPNAAERLKAHQPAGALGEAAADGLGLTRSGTGEVEYARSTGLRDFARGA